MKYDSTIKSKVISMRNEGSTIGEICRKYPAIPRSTILYWIRDEPLSESAKLVLQSKKEAGLAKARELAIAINKEKRRVYLNNLRRDNLTVAESVKNANTAKIALSMLCLGEASKYNPKSRSAFSLGSSNPKIIVLFLSLLKKCYVFDIKKVRLTVQCRADQDTHILEKKWSELTGISLEHFYKPQIDKRTVGKPTKKENYLGVLRVDYFSTEVQLDLETLADLVYNQLS